MKKLRKCSVAITFILLASLAEPVGGMMVASVSSRDSPYLNEKANAPPYTISPSARVILAENGFVVIPSKEFKDEKIRPSLIELTQMLLEESLHQYKRAEYPNIKEAALKNTMFFPVALKLVDSSNTGFESNNLISNKFHKYSSGRF